MNPQTTLPTPERKDHDQIFKRLFEAFLPEYMWLFHAEQAAQLDFSRIHFARQDLFSDLPHGDRRTLDVVAEVGPDTPEGRVVVLHGEIEYDRRVTVLEEMFEAYGWLRKRFRREVLPLLLYLTTGAEGRTEEVYVETALGRQVVEFRILCVALKGLDGLQYRNEANPLGPALASLMQHRGESRVSHKAHCLLGVAQAQVSDAGRVLLEHVIETYLPLDLSEEKEFQEMIQTPQFQEVNYLISPYELRGEARGEAAATRAILLLQLREKFGELPETQVARVEAADKAWCEARLRRILRARSLEELDLQ